MSSGLELKGTTEPPSIEGYTDDEAIELMEEWFHANYEDPAMETPYNGREGGYQYVWGGPYNASEELYDAFPDASDDLIELASQSIQSDGLFDWAPSGSRIQPDDEPGNFNEPPNLNDRLQALAGQLDRIESHIAYWRGRDWQVGHNNPPDEFRLDPEDIDLINAETSVAEIRVELAKPSPSTDADVEVIKKAEGRFRKLAKKIMKGLLALGAAAALGFVQGGAKHGGEHLASKSEAFAELLDDAARTLDEWATHIKTP